MKFTKTDADTMAKALDFYHDCLCISKGNRNWDQQQLAYRLYDAKVVLKKIRKMNRGLKPINFCERLVRSSVAVIKSILYKLTGKNRELRKA